MPDQITRRKRLYAVTNHAIDQLRHRHRSSADLSNEQARILISSIVQQTLEIVPSEPILDRGVPASLVRLPNFNLWAVIKPNEFQSPQDPQPRAIVTLLTDDMVERSRLSSIWTAQPKVTQSHESPAVKPLMTRSLATIGDVLRAKGLFPSAD